ncbi:TPA: calcium-binding protein, partial [Neisseria meningitidis]
MYSNNAITNNRNNITLGAYRDAIISIFSDENVVRAIGAINSMYEEYLTRSHKIDQKEFLREGERLSAKAREFQRTAEEAQKSLKEGIGRAASKFRGNSKEAFVARKVQSDLQKALNASNYNKQQYARRAATALENASKSKVMAANLGKFTYGATVAMGTLSMGSAWWKALDGEGNWSDVGLSSASFLGGLMGVQWGAALGVGAFGLLTGGAGWLVVGAILGGGAGAWWGSLGAEKAWRWFEDFLNLNRSDKYHVYDPLALDLDGDG